MQAPAICVARLVLAAVLTLTAAVATAQSELRSTLFADADEALNAANEARANLLAPSSYARGVEQYRQAEEKLSKGRSLGGIRKDLADAQAAFRKATEASELAAVTFDTVLRARADAELANAEQFSPEGWKDAEQKFADAAVRLEGGSIRPAKNRAEDAEALYREAELAAIKANYLDETRLLIQQADKDGVDRYAPKTLQKAEALLARAETSLNENRYDRDEPRSLARQAKYEALHAIHLAKVLEPVRDRDMTLEEFALMTEEPIRKIASDLDMVAELDEGYDKPVGLITEKIAALQKDSYELQERLGQISDLELEIQSLDSQLGTQSSLLAAQEEQRQRFSEIEAMFGPQEAELFTQGQDVIVRPIGLVFRSGSAQIETRYFDILRKIQDAIRVFPDSRISIEGHTDSFGSDAVNLRISQERAEAVRQYLLANMRDRDPSMIDAAGYGETNPVANNETADGRARNRRIDVVIRGTGRPTDAARK